VGEGAIIVNDKPFEEAIPHPTLRAEILKPLQVTGTEGRYNVVAKVQGGGFSGQVAAIQHGIAKALEEVDQTLKPTLRQHGLITRDPRVKERKKYGLKRARKAPQFTKR
jgi:small subunit ribosomal protein S9